jgi:hypothetical protein
VGAFRRIGPYRANSGQQLGSGFIGRVLRYEFSAERLRQDRLIQLRQETCGASVLGGYSIELSESSVNAVDYLTL